MLLRVLGPTGLQVGSRAVRLSPLRRRVVAALVLTRGAGAAAGDLIDLVWPERAPSAARPSLLNQLSWLRRQLPDGALVRDDGRYRLVPEEVDCDADRLLATRAALPADGCAPALSVLQATEPLRRGWAGAPYGDLPGPDPALSSARQELLAARRQLEARRAAALLEVGHLDDAIGLLEQLVRADPADEHGWAQLMAALADRGRRIEALEVYQQARRCFVGEHGLDVPDRLERLQRRVLGQHELPAAPGSRAELVPRPAEVARILAVLVDSSVLLVGGAGHGKSVLLAEVEQHWPRERGPVVRVPGGRGDRLGELLAHPGALTLLLDDLHHLDPGIQQLLGEALQRRPELRVLAAVRAPVHPTLAEVTRTLPVAPLTVDEVAQWLRRSSERLAPAGVARPTWEPLARRVHHETAGVPALVVAFGTARLEQAAAHHLTP